MCYWLVVSRGRGCRKVFYNAQDRAYLTNRAAAEIPCLNTMLEIRLFDRVENSLTVEILS